MRAHAHMRTRACAQANSAGTRRFPQQRQIKEKNATIRETKKYFFLIFFEKQFLSFYFEKSFETVFRKVILIEKQKGIKLFLNKFVPSSIFSSNIYRLLNNGF